jgi:hypothetical protein
MRPHDRRHGPRASERTAPDAEEREAYWGGYSDGLDRLRDHAHLLGARPKVRAEYLSGYSGGFHTRKRDEARASVGFVLARFMTRPRSLGPPWWDNYARRDA